MLSGRTQTRRLTRRNSLEYNPVTLKLDDLQALALKNRPEVASAEYNRRALSAAASLARSQSYPDLVLGKTLQGTDGVELGFVLPLFDFGGIPRGCSAGAASGESAGGRSAANPAKRGIRRAGGVQRA